MEPDPIEQHVGVRIRQRRMFLGMTSQQLGAVVGISAQQIKEYESVGSQLPISMLWRLGRALDVPPSYFFDDIDKTCLDPGGNVSRFPIERRNDVLDYLLRLANASEEDLSFIYDYLKLCDEPRRRARALVSANFQF